MAVKTCKAPDCGVEFEAKRSTAKYHSTTCRQRAGRARKAAAANAKDEAKSGGDAEHGLVRAVRLDLEKSNAIDTVAGQLALQIARRISDPDERGLSALSKELRALIAEAKGATPPDPDAGAGAATGPVEEDDVTKARRRREEIAAKAAAAEAQA